MILREIDRGGIERGRLEPGIHIAREREERGAFGRRGEIAEPVVIELRERGRDMHQVAQPLLGKVGGGCGELRCLRGEPRCRDGQVRQRRFVIECLGGREDRDHPRRLAGRWRAFNRRSRRAGHHATDHGTALGSLERVPPDHYSASDR